MSEVTKVALTICQPYASLIADGKKRVENRTWKPFSTLGDNFPIAIHAGVSRKWLDTHDGEMPSDMPFGAIVAVCRVIGVALPYDALKWDAEHSSGPWCWLLDDVRKLDVPIPCKGAQGLWFLDKETAAKLGRFFPAPSDGAEAAKARGGIWFRLRMAGERIRLVWSRDLRRIVETKD